MEEIGREAIRIARLAGMRIKELREKNEVEESLKDGYELVTFGRCITKDKRYQETRISCTGYMLGGMRENAGVL